MESILFEKVGSVAKITFNRPDVFNSFNREMALSMQARLDECASDTEIRAVYITGNGKAFGAGQDIGELTGDNPPALATILSEHYNPIVTRIRKLEKPVVCAVNGVAAGASANIALICDITIATESASFIQAFSKIGLIPDSGGTFSLPRLIGLQRATALMMLGEKVSATDAAAMGMIYKVERDDEFADKSWAIAVKLSKMPTKALGYIKKALNYSLTADLDKQLTMEEHLQVTASNTDDYKEGITAFIEKRRPTFKGGLTLKNAS